MRYALLVSCVLATSCSGAVASGPSAPRPARSPGPLPAARVEAPEHTALGLPFEGTWTVSQGYHGETTHRGYAAYALDLVKLDAEGRAHQRRGRRRQDWHGFGARALATADGVVVLARDHVPDNPIFGKATRTNSVIVQQADGEYSEYVHLQRGSLRVRVGEPVRRGQVLALCGNSGSETPHLHWALLSSIDPIRTRPAEFAEYEVRGDDGVWQRATGIPEVGDVIRPVQSPSRE